MADLLAGSKIMAADTPPTQSDFIATDETAFTSTTYTAGSFTVGTTFMAPTSGRVLIIWHGRAQSNTASVRVLISVAVRAGSTIGSGTSVAPAADEDAIETSNNARLGCSSHRVVDGLVAGDTYNVRVEHHVSSAGNGDVFHRTVDVIPLP